jgi:hypothetical protein
MNLASLSYMINANDDVIRFSIFNLIEFINLNKNLIN